MPINRTKFLTALPAAFSSAGMVSVPAENFYSPAPVVFQQTVGDERIVETEIDFSEAQAASTHTLAKFIVAAEERWTSSHDKRFNELAILDALDEASDEHRLEFARLIELRRRKLSPRTGAEILKDYILQKEVKKMTEAVQTFFKILKPHGSHHSK